ncbi:MAG: hypothetical protein Q7R41_16460 [Phycisphaerales bacterium]|nr:hypothetical protein [Phycisphaerales bacterium]
MGPPPRPYQGSRVLGKPEITSDAFFAYQVAVRFAFGDECNYGQIVNAVAGEPRKDAAHRSSPGAIVAVSRQVMTGAPAQISTRYAERSNLSLRMASRRFTRLTSGFSKKLENHGAAVGLYVGHYNFCRVHETTRTTPAVSLNLTDHVWSIGELIDNATALDPIDRNQQRRFRVIEGGLR